MMDCVLIRGKTALKLTFSGTEVHITKCFAYNANLSIVVVFDLLWSETALTSDGGSFHRQWRHLTIYFSSLKFERSFHLIKC
jgi:hypothetical protein